MKNLILIYCSLILFVLSLSVISCSGTKQTSSTKTNSFKGLTRVKSGFYTDSAGRLYELKFTFNGEKEGIRFDPYIRLWDKDTNWYSELGTVIDTSSYEHIKGCDFSRDKNHVYYFFGMSDGGFRRILSGANPKTFTCMEKMYRWGKDDQHVYYMYDCLTELDIHTCRFLAAGKDPAEFSNYITDGKVIYHEDNKLDSVDLKSFVLIDSAGYSARDKNFLYQGSWARRRLK